MQCDLCGSEEELFLTEIEGTKLNVCKNCSRYGTILKKEKKRIKQEPKKQNFELDDSETIQTFVPDFDKIIKQKRESMGLKQKEFARMIAEKESVIHKLESGSLEPSIDLARKLEKFLKIRLIESQKVEKSDIKTTPSSFTIGDIIKTRKKS
jgi:putative transcription factor